MKRFISIICAISLLLSSLALSSCEFGNDKSIEKAFINDEGELILVYENGDRDNLGKVVGSDGADGMNGQSGSTVITTEGNDTSVACAVGLRSAVSIVSSFKTTIHSSGFYPGWGGGSRTEEYQSSGSGVIYKLDHASGSAFIITNYHVVYDSSSDTENCISDDISVYLYGSAIEEKAIKASYVGGSSYYDIAVLYVENSDILKSSDAVAVTVTDSDLVSVGDSAIAIGNAQGLGISACFGVVSVDSEYITMTASDGKSEVSFRVMRVDAAVNSGNSGGGLYDASGKLIGIVNAKIVDDGVENIGYAIPSNVAVAIAENIIDYCFESENESVRRAMLGITVSTSDSKAIYDSESGLVKILETISVYQISENSLADGKLLEGDVFVSITVGDKTTEITRQYHVIDMMLSVRVGDVVELEVLRNGESEKISITITEDCLTSY